MLTNRIAVIYGKELRDLLRDRRAVRSMIIGPLIIIPLMMVGLTTFVTKMAERTHAEKLTVQVQGEAGASRMMAALRRDPRFEILPWTENWRARLLEKKLRLAVQIPSAWAASAAARRMESPVVYYYGGDMTSAFAADEIEAAFRRYKDDLVQERLLELHLSRDVIDPFGVRRESITPPAKMAADRVAWLLPFFVMTFAFAGGFYVAMEVTAGEKEKGTMEPLLCSPAPRTQIVLGKFLMVLTASLVSVALAAVSLGLSAPFFHFGPSAAGAPSSHLPAGSILAVVVMAFPLAMLFAAINVALGLWARNLREAATYISPVMFVCMAIGMVAMAPGIDLNFRLAVVPILGSQLAIRDAISGGWHWGPLAAAFGCMTAYAAIALAVAVHMFNRESVLFRS